MPNVMAASAVTTLWRYRNECIIIIINNTGGALCSTPQSLADAHYYSEFTEFTDASMPSQTILA